MSCGWLVQPDKHATKNDVVNSRSCDRRPDGVGAVSGEVVCAAVSHPPSTVAGAVTVRTDVAVTVRGTEHHASGHPVGERCRSHGVASISAVAGHRQTILSRLVTDGESGILGPVPGTGVTLDLRTEQFNDVSKSTYRCDNKK